MNEQEYEDFVDSFAADEKDMYLKKYSIYYLYRMELCDFDDDDCDDD